MRLSEGSDRYKVIAAAKKLRSLAEFKNVYINPDRTEAERELERQLRQKRDTLNKEEEEKPNEGRHCIFEEINCLRLTKSPTREQKVSPLKGPTESPLEKWNKPGKQSAYWKGQQLLRRIRQTLASTFSFTFNSFNSY